MNPVYSPGSSGVPYANAKGIGYPASFPMGYAAAAPAYSPNMYPGANPTFQTVEPGGPCRSKCLRAKAGAGAALATVVQPNGLPATVYPAPIAPPRGNGVTMGMVAGTTMAMSAGALLTAHSPTPVAPHPVTVPTYRAPGTPTYSYVPPQW
ncbi:myelin-associated neurite-outgrowth inhibitor [Carlito syrichta]|uniref:Myelin-associated neurite-outgrowth inhibitor n=1 Tax=Carlito syrichta TaxID=1868482 RepID=A0A3Q0EIH0_CARSF|nr:myelin-associated neurite-outgrowth inhibitor [Carlito syrichta]